MPGVLLQQEAEEKPTPSPMEVKEAGSEKEPEAPAARAIVGIIYPPPEVRSIQWLRVFFKEFLEFVIERGKGKRKR